MTPPLRIAIPTLLLLLAGCAHAAPVTLDGTWPLFNAAPGSCSAAPDTCKDLSTAVFYAQRQGATDSTLVYTATLSPTSAGVPFTITFNLADGMWNLWARVWNLVGRSSCRSNVVTRVIYTAPGSPTLR